MSTVDYRLNVNKAGMQRLKALAVEASERSIKKVGTIYVRAAAAATPPHDFADFLYSADMLRSRAHEDILWLRKKISRNIAGVNRPGDFQTAIAQRFRNLPGQWLALQSTRPTVVSKIVGPFGFVVPVNTRDRYGNAVPFVDPAQVYATARWDGHKMVPPQWKIRFVRKTKLEALVKRQQKQAGKLISGWAPAARVFAEGKNIAKGFFEELGGKGFGKIYSDKKGESRGVMINRQAYNSRLAAHMIESLEAVRIRTREARRVQIRNIAKWYATEARRY